MKTTAKNIILSLLLSVTFLTAKASCELYNLDFINNQLSGPTYSLTCASNVTPSQWEVRSDTCSFLSSAIVIPGSGMFATPVSVRINRSGNLECGDWFKLEYAIDNVWYTVDSVSACNMSSNVQNYNFNVVCGALSSINIRVTYSNNGGNPEKWFLKDGDICVSTPITIMPVELVDVTAIQEDGKVKLSWITATENNNDFFTVEKSEDGKNFDELQIVDGHGNSTYTVQYSIFDENPTYGVNYYRLKQTDFNGTFVYSKTVSVKNDIDMSGNFRVFPNPCEGGNFKIDMSGCKNKEVLVVLYDSFGKQVFSKVVLQKAETFYTAIDPNNKLNPGIYMVVGSSQEQVFFNHRLIVR